MRSHNLLVVDWDSFFPEPEPGSLESIQLYDWGHKEAPFFIDTIWGGRAESFVMNDVELPDLNGEELTFWDRVHVTYDAKLWYADSNSCAVNPIITGKRPKFDSVWLYDAHHDSGYYPDLEGYQRRQKIHEILTEGRYGCDNWTTFYAMVAGSLIYVRYPQWKPWALDREMEPLFDIERKVDDGVPPDVSFDRVFVCRSGAWVPPWHDMDARFEQFVQSAPVKRKVDIQPGGVVRRAFDIEDVKKNARRFKVMMRAWAVSRDTGEDQGIVLSRFLAELGAE